MSAFTGGTGLGGAYFTPPTVAERIERARAMAFVIAALTTAAESDDDNFSTFEVQNLIKGLAFDVAGEMHWLQLRLSKAGLARLAPDDDDLGR